MSREDSIGSKIKSIFRGSKQAAATAAPPRPAPAKGLILKSSQLKDLAAGSPTVQRTKALKELAESVQEKELQEGAAETVLLTIKDLFEPRASRDERHAALTFMSALVRGQGNTVEHLREKIFLLVKSLGTPEDLPLCLDILISLTDNGRTLTHFESQIGELLVSWQNTFALFEKKNEFLNLIVNVIKYNVAYLDEARTVELLRDTCHICTNTKSEDDIKLCLQIMEAMLCYSYLPSGSLSHVTTTLCLILTVKSLCDLAWKLMRKLLGTHLGHATVFTLCSLAQGRSREHVVPGSGSHQQHELVARGAVFMLGMGLWGAERVTSLKHSVAAILPSLLKAVECNSGIVSYEVAMALQRLVRCVGDKQPAAVWDLVMDLIEGLFAQVETSQTLTQQEGSKIKSCLHDILSCIEDLHEEGHFISTVGGGSERLFAIIEKHIAVRPSNSVLRLLNHRAQSCQPSDEYWLDNLSQLMNQYFACESRASIRLKALDVLEQIICNNRSLFEDEIISTVVLEQMKMLDVEDVVDIRSGGIKIIIDLAKTCTSALSFQLLDIVEKVMKRPRRLEPMLLPPDSSNDAATECEPELKDLYCCVSGLIDMFKEKMPNQSPDQLLRVYRMLIAYVSTQYQTSNGGQSETECLIKKLVFDLLLGMRADATGRLGLLMRSGNSSIGGIGGTILYSPQCIVSVLGSSSESSLAASAPSFLSADPLETSSTDVESPPMILQFSLALDIIIDCLQKETDWRVLALVLDKMTSQWQNKVLILSSCSSTQSSWSMLVAGGHNHIEKACGILCKMVGQNCQKYFERLSHRPSTLSCSDFHSAIFPLLTCMASYHSMLGSACQIELIKCLEFGLKTKNARTCVTTLSVCALEMEATMIRQLPAVLQSLLQITATKAMAVSILTFLSSLVKLPKLYKNFNEPQYKLIFAIALSYTDPQRFPHFAVYLAHHVIAMWFVKCRVTYRRQFVSYIIQGLRSNALQQFEERSTRASLAIPDEPSKGLSRSSSTAMAVATSATASSSSLCAADEKMLLFHSELAETCTDLMSRYVYATCSTVPKRTPVSEFLLEGGLSQTWLIGNKLVTITTSGGGVKATSSGLCSRCTAAVRAGASTTSEPATAVIPDDPTSGGSQEAGDGLGSKRRRHRSAIGAADAAGHSAGMSSPSTAGITQSRDDLELNRRASREKAFLDNQANDRGDQDVLLSLGKAALQSGSEGQFNPSYCNCWCNDWAEIYIRRPSGSVSWVMRIQNRRLFSSEESARLAADICSLFTPGAPAKLPDTETAALLRRTAVDAESIEERDYASMHAMHFGGSSGSPTVGTVSGPSSRPVSALFADEEVTLASASTPAASRNEAAQQKELDRVDLGSAAQKKSDSLPELANGKESQEKMQPNPFFKRDVARLMSFDGSTSKFKGGFHDHPHMQHDNYAGEDDDSADVGMVMRKRGHTISALGSSGSPDTTMQGVHDSARQRRDVAANAALNPSFVFLQLYHSGVLRAPDIPMLIPDGKDGKEDEFARAVRNLDRIPSYETHKVGVVYVGPGQASDEGAILSNVYGSERYANFLRHLGDLVRLRDCNPEHVFTGGLDTESGMDGEYAYMWHDDIIQMIFHVATMMPHRENDTKCNNKKRHIGNDYVTIVYNDSTEPYSIGTIKGNFNYVSIVIQPLDHVSNAVSVQTDRDIADIVGQTDTKIVSDSNLGLLVREMALHSSMASLILVHMKKDPQDPFASNWLERLRQIKRIRKKIIDRSGSQSRGRDAEGIDMHDFTDYV